MARELVGEANGAGLRVAVVVSRFNEFITERLLAGALSELKALGVDDDAVTVAWVPGAFEMPIVAKAAAGSGKYDAVVCLGAVLRGETDHYQHVCDGAAKGILQAGLETGVPAMFGVLTVDSLEQAIHRAGAKLGNKGGETARAAVETARLLSHLRDPSS